jgi:hypothetical protein
VWSGVRLYVVDKEWLRLFGVHGEYDNWFGGQFRLD